MREERAAADARTSSFAAIRVAAHPGQRQPVRHDKMRPVTHHPPEGTVRPESGLTDDDFSPVWADDDRPRIPRVAAEREALAACLEYYRATVEMKCRGLTSVQARTRS